MALFFFDRQNYRATLTESGKAFYEKCQDVLFESSQLKELGQFLAKDIEPYLKISINIVSPVPQLLNFIKDFFDKFPKTEPEIYFDVLKGSIEKLNNRQVDISFSSVLPNESEYDKLFLMNTNLIPVAKPGFLPLDSKNAITDKELKKYVQIIVSDSSSKREDAKYNVISGGKSWTVNSMHVKKEILLAGMGWGTLPEYLVKNELKNDQLIELKNASIPVFEIPIYALRLKSKIHGHVAEELWKKLTNFNF